MEVPQRGGSYAGGPAIVCCEVVLVEVVVGRMWEPWAKALPGFRLVPATATSTPVGTVSLLGGVVVVPLTLSFR